MASGATSHWNDRIPLRARRAALRCAALALGLCLSSVPVPGSAVEPAPEKDWEVEIEPYGWLALAWGQIDTDRFGKKEFTIDAGEVLDSFDLGAMGAVKLRWRRFVALLDVAWAKLSADDKIGDTRVSYDLTQELGWFEALAGYRVYERPGGLFGTPAPVERRVFGVDVMGGLTYSWANLDLDLSRDPLLEIPPQERHLRVDEDWLAPYLALRFHNDFTNRFRMETLIGVGGFGAGDAPDVVWQVTPLFGYAITDHVLLNVGYRALGRHDSDVDLIFHGPIVGATFRF
jgi:hypothetical protein